jgi:hypothetical protein
VRAATGKTHASADITALPGDDGSLDAQARGRPQRGHISARTTPALIRTGVGEHVEQSRAPGLAPQGQRGFGGLGRRLATPAPAPPPLALPRAAAGIGHRRVQDDLAKIAAADAYYATDVYYGCAQMVVAGIKSCKEVRAVYAAFGDTGTVFSGARMESANIFRKSSAVISKRTVTWAWPHCRFVLLHYCINFYLTQMSSLWIQ